MGNSRRCGRKRRICYRRSFARNEEEAGVEPDSVDIVGAWCEDHGSWSYTTVFAFEREGFEIIPSAADDESIDVAWVDVNEVSDLPLLSAFARDWPAFAQKLSGLYAENIMAE